MNEHRANYYIGTILHNIGFILQLVHDNSQESQNETLEKNRQDLLQAMNARKTKFLFTADLSPDQQYLIEQLKNEEAVGKFLRYMMQVKPIVHSCRKIFTELKHIDIVEDTLYDLARLIKDLQTGSLLVIEDQ